MKRLWSVAAVVPVLLLVFASAPLFAQAAAGPLSSDPTAVAGAQTSAAQAGTIVGTVTDLNDSPVNGATVVLLGADGSEIRSVTTNEGGFFEIYNVEPGQPYQVSVRAAGFAEWKSEAVTLAPGQYKIVDVSKLHIQEVQTTVTVTPESSEEIAIEQVKTAETQRIFGILPNFYAVSAPNLQPLSTKLRFQLALRLARDPFTVAGVAMLAGIGQAANNPPYVQGLKGYGERFGANYANNFTDIMMTGAVLPSLLHQDPRYYYARTGSIPARALHALSSLFVAKGDNGNLQPNYSSLGGDLTSAALANLYYPKASRGAGLVFEGFGINTAIHAAVRLLDQFVFRPSAER